MIFQSSFGTEAFILSILVPGNLRNPPKIPLNSCFFIIFLRILFFMDANF